MTRLQSLVRRCIATAGAGLAACVLAARVAPGQDQSAATPADAIFARKIMMGTIGGMMDEIETMIAPPGKINLAEGREHADLISVMLMAFPHLFPPSTNQWKPNADRDPGRDTYAAPEVWSKFADFYARAERASKVAYNASRANAESEFTAAVAELRTACDSCHAVYQKSD
jgi:cytochrome c556